MRILYSVPGLKKGGATQVALSIISEFKKFPDNEYHICINKVLEPNLDIESFGANFIFYIFDWDFLKPTQISERAKKMLKIEKEIKPDIVFSNTGPIYWRPKSTTIIGYNLGLFLYPETPYLNTFSTKRKIKYTLKKYVQNKFFKREADIVITQTDDVNQRVRKVLGKEKVFTITNNCSTFFWEFSQYRPIIGKKKDGKIRLLTITAYYSHKNLEIIPSVIEALTEKGINNVEFVLTLKDEDYQRVIPEEYHSKVCNVGFVEPKDAPSLYCECDVMFLPTLAECFSASYPEAMIMGLPIVTTDLGFARGICGNAGLFFEPMNGADAADKIKTLIDNTALYEVLVAKGKKELQKFDLPSERARKILQLAEEQIKKHES